MVKFTNVSILAVDAGQFLSCKTRSHNHPLARLVFIIGFGFYFCKFCGEQFRLNCPLEPNDFAWGTRDCKCLPSKIMHTACLGLRLGQWGCHFWNLHQILHLHGVPHFSLSCHGCCAMTLHSVGGVILHPKEQFSLNCSCTPTQPNMQRAVQPELLFSVMLQWHAPTSSSRAVQAELLHTLDDVQ